MDSSFDVAGAAAVLDVVDVIKRTSHAARDAWVERIAQSIADEKPNLFTTNMSKKERVKRIFVDYLRNAEGATTVAAYSVRARHGAPVSTPLHWDELGGRMKPAQFHAGNVARRMRGTRPDPWKAFYRTAQTLTAAMKRKLGILQ